MPIFMNDEIEDMILGMADVVMENRRLRKEVEDLSLDIAIYESHQNIMLRSTKENEDKYNKLVEIRRNNLSVDLCNHSGWSTNKHRIDWQEEMEK